MKILEHFPDTSIDANEVRVFASRARRAISYLVAITPRSGSSFFASLLTETHLLGEPGRELINYETMPIRIAEMESTNLVQHLNRTRWRFSSTNGVFALKASYFHFEPFIQQGLSETMFGTFQYVYLTRQDIVSQAVSLYLATETNIFHSTTHSWSELVAHRERVLYDEIKVRQWLQHLVLQELGWEAFFAIRQIEPLRLHYHEVVASPPDCIAEVAHHLGVPVMLPIEASRSNFKKLPPEHSTRLSELFISNEHNRTVLEDLGVDKARFR